MRNKFGYEVKDDDGNKKTTEPEVAKMVQAEIKKLGDNTKANYDELRKSHEALKKLIDEQGENMDAVVKAQAKKLTEDIITRQEALDAKIVEANEAASAEITSKFEGQLEELATKRINAIEAAMKRSPQSGQQSAEAIAQEQKDAKQFIINATTTRKGDAGLTAEKADALELSVEEFRAYRKSFITFMRKDERLLSPDDVKAMTVAIDPDGGYTVTPYMSNRITKRIYEGDPVRSLSAHENITTGALEFMVDFDEAGWGWEGETESGDETNTPQIFKKRIPVHVMYAKPRASQTLLEDSGINIENWLSDKVASRFLRGEGAAFVNGDGVGKPRGFLTYANYTTAGVDEWGKIERTNMRAAAALTADGFIAVKYSLVEEYLNRGTWLMNRGTVADAMYLKDGAGRYIWKPGFQDDSQSTILGLPVRMSTTMPAVAAGILSVALADWKEAYMVVDRLGVTIQRDPFTKKPMVEFYTRKRVGGDVVNYQAIKLGNIAV